jgi:tetratricopeptide (TPR) repeat protein
MPAHAPARARRWQAMLIIAVAGAAVAGAAAVGWWYARESPAHQGPIVLISVDGVPATTLPAYGGLGTDTPAIDTLAADAVVFERAYTHSPLTLPAHASIFSGQLPFEHGVRDDAGFALKTDVRTLAELLRNRGFSTGAAVSTFLLRRESGVAQGFTFFDADFPAPVPGAPPALGRDGAETVQAAERWMQTQDGQRFFVFVQVDARAADAAVTRLSQLLKQRGLYNGATIIFIGDRGDAGSGTTLDDAALRIPFLVKQPASEGAGRRIASPVQHIDLVPTILDLVRAPLPDLPGRSLRALLDDDGATLDAEPIYSESMTARFRFGGHPVFALTSDGYRYVRGIEEDLVTLDPPPAEGRAGESAESGRLRVALDRLLGSTEVEPPSPLAPGDEERYALFGYLGTPRLPGAAEAVLAAETQKAVASAHHAAAVLIGHKNYSAGIRALQAIVREHPMLAVVHHQLGAVLVRTGRLEEAIAAFRMVSELRPDSTEVVLALADALMRAGDTALAQEQAEAAVALAQKEDGPVRSAAHAMAARVALARKDAAAATRHAEAAHAADETMPVPELVRGRLLYAEGRYEEAAAEFMRAEASLQASGAALRDLHLYLGESLALLDRYPEAEVQFREELLAFPRNIQAYASLAMLYRASSRYEAVEDVLNELVAATPTPEGYGMAARLWTILGDRSRAEALRSDARTRFRGDPSLALLGRDGRR